MPTGDTERPSDSVEEVAMAKLCDIGDKESLQAFRRAKL
jgi:hypothetical protein